MLQGRLWFLCNSLFPPLPPINKVKYQLRKSEEEHAVSPSAVTLPPYWALRSSEPGDNCNGPYSAMSAMMDGKFNEQEGFADRTRHFLLSWGP